jgi:hypothetical protein
MSRARSAAFSFSFAFNQLIFSLAVADDEAGNVAMKT